MNSEKEQDQNLSVTDLMNSDMQRINPMELRQKLDEQIIKQAEKNVKDKFQSEAVMDQAVMLAAESEDRVSANSPILRAIQNAKNAETDDFETLYEFV